MKNLGFFLAACLAVSELTGCSATMQSIDKSIQNQVGGGLNRQVTFYAYDGTPIKTWKGRIFIEPNEEHAMHFMVDGKRVAISGAYSIEEY